MGKFNMANVLEDFVEMYDEVAKAKGRIAAIEKNPYDEDAYNDGIKQASKILGADPRVPDEKGNIPELSPRTIRGFLEAWVKSAKSTTLAQAEANLESILDKIDSDKFSDVLMSTTPYKGSEYKDVGELHQEYLQMQQILHTYKNTQDVEQKQGLAEVMRKKVPKLVEERIREYNEERKAQGDITALDEKGIKMWTGVLSYLAAGSSQFAVQIYGNGVERQFEKIKSRLSGNKIKDYVAQSAKDISGKYTDAQNDFNAETDVDKKKKYETAAKKLNSTREGFYEGLYQVAKAA